MKIAAIAPSSVPSRTANSIQVMKTCSALAAAGNEVRLWVSGRGHADWSTLESQYGLDCEFTIRWIRTFRPLRKYDLSFSALAQAQHWGAELVYTWLPQVAVYALKRGIPAMLEMHDLPTGMFAPRYFKQFANMPGNKRLLPITAALKTRLETISGTTFKDAQVAITPNGVEYLRFADQPEAPQARKMLGFAEQPTAVFSGHFYTGRGMPLLLELAHRLPEIHFLWVGGRDEDVATWRERIQQAGLTNITLTGFIPNKDLPLYLAAGDFLLMPYETRISGSSGGNSAEICSPMKMFEYMATGRVILTSDLPVIHEVLNENNAIFCTPEDVDSWNAALVHATHDPALCQKLANQAKKDAEAYTWLARAHKALLGFTPSKSS